MSQIAFDRVVSKGCGLDVHQKTVVATIDGEGIRKVTREFGTFTRSLTELRDWLLEHGVTHAAMESTGVYWEARLSHLGADGDEGLDCQCPARQVRPGP